MSGTSAVETELARRALQELNSGDTDLARALLESLLEAEHERSSVPQHSPAAQRTSRAILACTLGRPHWTGTPWSTDARRKTDLLAALVSPNGAVTSVSQEGALETAKRLVSTLSAQDRADVARTYLFFDTEPWSTATSALGSLMSQCGYSAWDGTDEHAVETLVRSRVLDSHLAEKATSRVVFIAYRSGMTQRKIARLLHEPQTKVHRRLKQLEEQPADMVVLPSEIVDQFKSEQIDRAEMLSLLAAYPYDRGHYPEGAEDWAYVPGSWDELALLTVSGDLDQDEFEFIVSAVENRSHDGAPAHA